MFAYVFDANCNHDVSIHELYNAMQYQGKAHFIRLNDGINTMVFLRRISDETRALVKSLHMEKKICSRNCIER